MEKDTFFLCCQDVESHGWLIAQHTGYYQTNLKLRVVPARRQKMDSTHQQIPKMVELPSRHQKDHPSRIALVQLLEGGARKTD